MKRLATLAFGMLLLAACASTQPGEPTLNADDPQLGSEAVSYPPGSQAALEAEAGDLVYFAFDSSVLRPESQAVVRQQATWLQQNATVTVTVAGHTDERGTREYNLALGERRANAVRSYLIGLGIEPNRVRTISYGEERPAVAGSGEQAWAANRRAQTLVSPTS
jgi:peptidoglycan-associated lipoprotein